MKVLIVEREPTFTRSVLAALTREGHHVEVVASAAVLAGQLGGGRHDVVILDAEVPSLDGRQACLALRAGGAATAILMLSARAGADERIAGLDAGADDFLARPFDLEEFLARVRALGRRAGATEADDSSPSRASEPG